MMCDEVTELIIDYLEGELPKRPAEAIRQHLEECAICREVAEQFEKTLDSVADAVDDPGDAYFANLYPRIMERIESDEGLPWHRRILSGLSPFQRWSLVGAPLALALVIGLLLLFPTAFSNNSIVTPSGKTVHTAIQPKALNPSVVMRMPGEEVADLTEKEVDDLHHALIVALEDVLAEESVKDEFGVTTVIPYDATALPSTLYILDPEDLGEVFDEMTEESGENTI